ncbi:hypothetical protein HYZ97_04700, partial [Candidatus Pacearchaeota archaeon]|nr:hypothetical protein [Candidatus Pacearchaeota archaeon]
GEVERIVIKRLYIGRAALFGLLYGAFLGIIMALVILASAFASSNVEGYAFLAEFLGPGFIFILAFLVLIACAVLSCIGAVLTAVLYNLVSRFGGSMHLDLGEYDAPAAVMKPAESTIQTSDSFR